MKQVDDHSDKGSDLLHQQRCPGFFMPPGGTEMLHYPPLDPSTYNIEFTDETPTQNPSVIGFPDETLLFETSGIKLPDETHSLQPAVIGLPNESPLLDPQENGQHPGWQHVGANHCPLTNPHEMENAHGEWEMP